MGMSASQGRLMALTARLSDLELKAQQIQNSKINISRNQEQVALDYTNTLQNDSASESQKNAAEALFNQKTAALEANEKILDMTLTGINTEHTALQTEVDSVKKVIDKNIDRSFKIFDA